jgi:membrane-associated protease RseP (regulator of RpoE activity)
MVLRFRRAGLVAALLAFVSIGADAQGGRGFRDRPQTAADTMERFGRGIGGFNGFNDRAGGPRPLLFGFALECTRCTPTNRRGGFGGGPMAVWHYDEFPRVAAVVEGSPAARAGIREGDLLLDVGGASLTTDAGAQAFSALRPGDTARLTLERNGKSYNATLVLGRGQAMGGAGRGALRFGEQPHFSTRVGTTAIDIESDVPVISTTDSSGNTTLRIGSTTIRLRPAGPKTP